jgi:hypothetical protein
LPLFLYWYTMNVLSTKPPGVSQPDVSKHPDVPTQGYFRLWIGKKPIQIRSLYISIAMFFVILLLGVNGLMNTPEGVKYTFEKVLYSTLIIVGLCAAIAFYTLANSIQRMSVREKVKKVEDEFGEAIFQLGNQLSTGMPIERAIEKSEANIRELTISQFYGIIRQNMNSMGMTFQQAIFDKEYGAIWFFPSKLIGSVMMVVSQAVKKGVGIAALSLLSIARYLRDIHSIEEDIREILSETTSSMKFLAAFLAPLVAGITVTLALIIMNIMTVLQTKLSGLSMAGAASQGLPTFFLKASSEAGIPAELFQLVVGIYMVEVCLLLSIFISRVESGSDKVGLDLMIGVNTLIALIVYCISMFIGYSLFGTPIAGLLTSGLG